MSNLTQESYQDRRHPEYKHNMPLNRTGVAAAIILAILFLLGISQ